LKGSDAGLVLCSCTLLRSFTSQPAFLLSKRLELVDILLQPLAIGALSNTVALGLQADLFFELPLSALLIRVKRALCDCATRLKT
jgi:hypothetical protein